MSFSIFALLLSFLVNDSLAWTTDIRSAAVDRRVAVGLLQAHPKSRRSFLATSVGGCLVLGNTVIVPSIAWAADDKKKDSTDPLDAFGKQLQQQGVPSSAKWPQSPSPLPTRTKSASELTLPNDMQDALDRAAKKKKIDPRTHG
jgi:hypothetical protein